MSESFSPGPGVEPQSPYSTVFLSQRDLGLRTPINFVTGPGVSLTAACFPHLRYEDDSAGDCLSNLLGVGFHRFEIDLYWDQGRKVWSFCPVSVPTSIPNVIPSSTTTLSFISDTRSSLTSDTTASISSSSPQNLNPRQVSSRSITGPLTSSSSELTHTAATSLGNVLPTIAVLPDTPDEPLISIGPYVCTTTINLSTFTSQLLDYIQKTQMTLDAHLLYIILNIHAATPGESPASPAPAPTSLPGPSSLLGGMVSGNLSQYLYRLSDLQSDRANLNGSWYSVSETYRPVEEYYSIDVNENGIYSTEDGWPSEGYLEFSNSKRLLVGWGTIDPQMAGYNFTGDSGVIFPSGFLQNVQADVTASSAGRLTSGCFLGNLTDDLTQIHSSWAFDAILPGFDYPTSASSDINPLLNLASNSTNCGISPILNVTLLNSTALDDYKPYQNFSYATIWSWAPGEPKNYTESSSSNSGSIFRCATSNIDLDGRWMVADCSQKYYAACRAHNQPYNWTITNYPISYSFASQACKDPYYFTAPRTALENSYLTQEMRRTRLDFDGGGAWVDFNSLDVAGCWVTGGPNATCLWKDTLSQENDLEKQVILVPTVAAIIVLVVTALTIFVKAAGNRRVRKRRRRRAENGFVYEGVPS